MRPPLPPGSTEVVAATTVLVLAPHYDDEVVGCGGLVAELAGRGAEVSVLFLTDGSGGVEEVADREGYRARRRREAAAAAEVLGIALVEHLELPDGGLGRHREALAAGIRERLERRPPDLLLAPSPLEVTADHRAVVAALHDVLAPLRDGDGLAATLAGLRVLLYEVNHPLHPDLLVDVGSRLEQIERAMACYVSQLERHDYLAATLGLRRFRTLTLPPGTAAAEAYRGLGLGDFTTRSLSHLVREIGGLPELAEVDAGPLVSVVVRTHDRPELLAEALASVAVSTYRRVELVLVNDGGAPPAVPEGFPFPVRRVERGARGGRATAANDGLAAATGDWVAFLDDDDRFEPEHLETLVGLVAAAGVEVAYTDAAVVLHELDPAGGWREVERRLPYSRDFDLERLRVDNYIPFNTLLIARQRALAAGKFDPELEFFEDWDFLVRLGQLVPFHHLARVTCEYRQFRGGGHVLGERPRQRADFLETKGRVVARHLDGLGAAGLARVVDGLRAEAVEAAEAAAGARRGGEEARRRAAAAEDRAHRANGELVALRGERERLLREGAERDEELRRLYAVEEELRRAVAVAEARGAEQDELLRQLYAEIERLGEVIEVMRGTRAWRAHEWLERRRR